MSIGTNPTWTRTIVEVRILFEGFKDKVEPGSRRLFATHFGLTAKVRSNIQNQRLTI